MGFGHNTCDMVITKTAIGIHSQNVGRFQCRHEYICQKGVVSRETRLRFFLFSAWRDAVFVCFSFPGNWVFAVGELLEPLSGEF